MSPVKGIFRAPKYYKSVDNLIEEAYRALLNLKQGLKIEVAIELYLQIPLIHGYTFEFVNVRCLVK